MDSRYDLEQFQKAIAQRIRTLRKSAGFTQEQLSDMADMGPKYLSRLESAKALPSLVMILNLATALKVEPAELIGNMEDDTRIARGDRIMAALSTLNESDAAFLEEEILDWVAHLKNKTE